MRKTGKALLSVMLTLSMLCGLLLPAGAWYYDMSFGQYLLSPDGVHWFDERAFNSDKWTKPDSATPVTVYSTDNILWYTAQGLSFYLSMTDVPTNDPGWTSITLPDTFQSPDNGKMWLYEIYGPQWRDWYSYWQQTEGIENCTEYDVMLYRENNAFVCSTVPYTSQCNPFPVPKYEDASASPLQIAYAFHAQSDMRTGVVLSADGVNWKTMLEPIDLFYNTNDPNYNPNYDPNPNNGQYEKELDPYQSFNPYTMSVTKGSFSPMDGLLYLEDGHPLTLIDNPNFYILHLKSTRECTVTLRMHQSTINPFFSMVHLGAFMPGEVQQIISPSVPGVPSPLTTTQFAVFGNSMNGTDVCSYTPLQMATQHAVIADLNNNGIIDQDEIQTPSVRLDDRQVNVYPNGTSVVLHLNANMEYPLPVYFWAEGQYQNSVGNYCQQYGNCFLEILPQYAGREIQQYPITYAVDTQTNSAVITDFDASYFVPYTDGAAGDRSGFGCRFDPRQGVLTLPEMINGYPVEEIADNALVNATTPPYDNTVPTVRKIVLPDSVQTIGHAAFGSTLQQLHVPGNANIEYDTFSMCPTVSLCSESANGWAADFSQMYNIPFSTCVGHPAAAIEMTAPTDPVYTGDEVTVTAALTQNDGLAGLSVQLNYDADVLTLTNVQAAGMLSAGNLILSGNYSTVPYNVLWDDALSTSDHTDVGTILTFTFSVKDTASADTTTVSLTYDTESVFDIDLQNVPIVIENTTIAVLKHLPGDADGDGEFDLADVTNLARYLAGGWDDAQVDLRNADVNGDGVVNLKDVVLMRRSLAGGWGVTLV